MHKINKNILKNRQTQNQKYFLSIQDYSKV